MLESAICRQHPKQISDDWCAFQSGSAGIVETSGFSHIHSWHIQVNESGSSWLPMPAAPPQAESQSPCQPMAMTRSLAIQADSVQRSHEALRPTIQSKRLSWSELISKQSVLVAANRHHAIGKKRLLSHDWKRLGGLRTRQVQHMWSKACTYNLQLIAVISSSTFHMIVVFVLHGPCCPSLPFEVKSNKGSGMNCADFGDQVVLPNKINWEAKTRAVLLNWNSMFKFAPWPETIAAVEVKSEVRLQSFNLNSGLKVESTLYLQPWSRRDRLLKWELSLNYSVAGPNL